MQAIALENAKKKHANVIGEVKEIMYGLESKYNREQSELNKIRRVFGLNKHKNNF